MNWESSILNKIYKTLDFKLNVSNLNSIKNKSDYVAKLNKAIDNYDLRQFKICVNFNGALYRINNNSTNTFYFDYDTNYHFILYTNFFDLESKFLKHEHLTYVRKIKSNLPNDEVEYFGFEEIVIDGYEQAKYLQTFLLKLIFEKDYNVSEFYNLLSKLNDYLKLPTYLIGLSASHYDVILLSIFTNWKKKSEREQYFLEKNFLHLKRWSEHLEQIFEIDMDRIEKSKKSRWKESLGETYKLTSNQDLVKAVLNDNINAIIELLDEGENVNSRELQDFKTLAHLACKKGNLNILKILTKYGCDLEALDFEFMTPIYDAIYSKDLNICEYLIEKMKVNIEHREIQNRTPFYWAACSADLQMVEYLLSKKVNINTPSSMGRTPLSKACWNGKVEIVDRLCREKDLIVNYPDKNGRYPLHNAVWGEYGGRLGKKVSGDNSKDSPEAALHLINAGHLIEVEDHEGFTPLMIASSTNGLASLELLLSKGADTNHLNIYGATAIIESTRYGNSEPVTILLKKGHDINVDIRDKYGMNALDYSIVFKRIECLIILLRYKEQNNILKDDELIQLLILSIKSNSMASFKILLEYAKKREVFNNISDKYHNHYINFKELIERILNLSRISMYNFLVNEYQNLVNIIFFSDIQFLVKSLVISHDLSNFVENWNKDNSESTGKKYLAYLSTNEDKKIYENGDPIPNKEVFNNQKNEASNYEFISEGESSVTKEDCHLFCENLETSFQIYLSKLKNNSLEISHSLLKILIHLNDYSKTLAILQLIQSSNDTYNIKDDDININPEFYTYTEVDKKRKIERSILELKWSNTLREISSNNILSLSMAKADNYFFNEIIELKFTKNLFFSKLPNNHSNLLHIIFKYNKLQNLIKIINLVETNFPNKLHILIEMLDDYDYHNLTPLDILIKSHMFESVEIYTNILNELREKHKIDIKNHNHIFYKIMDFNVIKESILHLPDEYKKYIENSLKETNSILKKNSLSDLNILGGFYYTYNCISEKMNQIYKEIPNLIQKINQKNIREDFILNNKNSKNSIHWVENKEQLKDCCGHLKQFNFIGVDLEFFGNDSEGIVCVIQISTMEKCFAIDSLKMRSEITLHLKEIFEDDKIIKILHGCDNDIAWLVTNFEIYTKNVFDTGRAFLIFQKNILNKSFKVNNLPSLYYLTKFFMQVELDKAYQKSDWRIRPLTRNMFQYALNDAKSVIYLFLLFLGLFHYILGYETDEISKGFFEKIIDKFSDNKENIGKQPKIFNLNEVGFIFVEISLRCHELIKAKLKDSFYYKLSIKMNY